MSTTTTHRTKAVAALITIGALAACGGGGTNEGTGGGGTFKIGIATPLSGPSAAAGQVFDPAFKAAIDYVNSSKLIDGKIEGAYEDNQCNAGASTAAAQKFVSVEKVTAMTVICSSGLQAAVPVAERNKTLIVNSLSVSPAIAGLSDNVVSLTPLLKGELPPILSYAAKELGVKNLAVIYSDEALGKAAVQLIDTMAPKLGLAVAGSVSVDPTQTTDFSSQVAKVAGMKPDAVFVAMVGGAGGLLTGLKAANVKAQVLGYDLFNTPATTALPAAQGAVYAVQDFDLTATDDLTKGFLETFKSQNKGVEPNVQQVGAANAVFTVARIIAKLQAGGKDVTAESVLKEASDATEFSLVGGDVNIKRPGAYAVSGIRFLKIKNQKTETLSVISVPEVDSLQKLAGL